MIFKSSISFALFASIVVSYSTVAQIDVAPAWSFLAHATTSDHVTDIWVSPQGESYQFGHITTLPGNPAPDGLMLVKANADGQEVWRRYYHGQSGEYQLFSSSVVGDENGNVFLVYSENFRYTELTSARIAVKKIDPDGNEIWGHFYTETIQNLVETPMARSGLYKNGTLYFVSGTGGTNPSDDMDAMIVKIDGATGNLIQKIVFNSQYDTDDMLRRVEVAENGDMWAVGRSRGYMYPGGIYSDYDANVVKYNAAGEFQWEHRENGTSNNVDYGINMTIDAEGNCYTSNQLRMIGVNQRKVQIQKIAPNGTVLWTHFYQGSSSGYNHDQPVIVLPDGNIAFSASNEEGIVIRTINGQTGETIWTQNYNRSGAGAANRPYDMKADSAGNIFVIGESRDNTPFGNGWDMVTLKYSSAGELLWLSNFNRGNYDTMGEHGVALQFDANENVYVTGTSQLGESAGYNSDFLLLKYGNGTLGVAQNETGMFSCYPNPAHGILNIRNSKQNPLSSVALIDIYGHTIRQWDNPAMVSSESSIDIQGIAQGVYIVKVQSENQSAVLKILKK